MTGYDIREVQERDLEDIVRKFADKIELGLKYLTHQKKTQGGRLDVLFVDSGGALAVAELKVAEDDNMLVQALDYYSDVVQSQETLARAYTRGGITVSPTQRPRLLLIAPSFSASLLNRCKWIDIPISLFTFKCISLTEKQSQVIPVFNEVSIPTKPEPVEIPTIDGHLNYITDEKVKNTVQGLLKEISEWESESVTIDPIRDCLSMKVSNRVFGYLASRRKHFIIETYDEDGDWVAYAIHDDNDLAKTKAILRSNFDYYRKKQASSSKKP